MSAERARIRLSSIDLLPEAADADVEWAIQELEAGGRHQKDVWNEFNARLADHGIGPVSHSAFGRYALRKRQDFAQLREVREISLAITQALGPGDDDALMTALAQMIKTRVYQLVRAGQDVGSKGIMELSRAVQSIVSAQRMSAQNRQQLEENVKARIGKAVDAAETALAASGTAPPDGVAVLKKIREDIYGIFDK